MSEVKYTYIEHWIPKQAESEKAMLAEFEAGNYTLENPLVKYNPYFINPLAAVVLFKTEKEIIDEFYNGPYYAGEGKYGPGTGADGAAAVLQYRRRSVPGRAESGGCRQLYRIYYKGKCTDQ